MSTFDGHEMYTPAECRNDYARAHEALGAMGIEREVGAEVAKSGEVHNIEPASSPPLVASARDLRAAGGGAGGENGGSEGNSKGSGDGEEKGAGMISCPEYSWDEEDGELYDDDLEGEALRHMVPAEEQESSATAGHAARHAAEHAETSFSGADLGAQQREECFRRDQERAEREERELERHEQERARMQEEERKAAAQEAQMERARVENERACERRGLEERQKLQEQQRQQQEMEEEAGNNVRDTTPQRRSFSCPLPFSRLVAGCARLRALFVAQHYI